MLAGI